MCRGHRECVRVKESVSVYVKKSVCACEGKRACVKESVCACEGKGVRM